jgi:molybdate transport system substrate-binding protein
MSRARGCPIPAVRWLDAVVAVIVIAVAGVGVPVAPAVAAPPAGPETAPEVMVYAAASLSDALEEMAPACGRAAGARLVFNFAGSNDLARQIMAAGRADLFLSADEDWMDRVEAAGFVEPGSRRTLLANRLAVIARRDADAPAEEGARALLSPAIRRLALANPDVVPAGRYARAWLQAAGVWDALAPRVLPTLDVRAALAAVESGAAEAGIVYRTDAALSIKVRVVYEVPAGEGPRISYPMAILRDRPHAEAARRIAACIAGADAAAVFARSGFIVTAAAPANAAAPATAAAP